MPWSPFWLTAKRPLQETESCHALLHMATLDRCIHPMVHHDFCEMRGQAHRPCASRLGSPSLDWLPGMHCLVEVAHGQAGTGALRLTVLIIDMPAMLPQAPHYTGMWDGVQKLTKPYCRA